MQEHPPIYYAIHSNAMPIGRFWIYRPKPRLPYFVDFIQIVKRPHYPWKQKIRRRVIYLHPLSAGLL